MRGKGRHIGLFAVLVMTMIVAGGAAAGARRGWHGRSHDGGDDNSREIKQLIDSSRPKNVILLIGDGMATARSPWRATTARAPMAL